MAKKKRPTSKVSLSYGACTIYTTIGQLTCPLCGVKVDAGVVHQCSRPKP